MNDEDVISELMKLDKMDYVKIRQLRPHSGDVMSRLLLHDLGFSLLDGESMRRFRKLHSEAGKRLVEKVAEEDIARRRNTKALIAEAAARLKGKITIFGSHQNVSINGLMLRFKCPNCGQKQKIDLTKTPYDNGYLKIDGKNVPAEKGRGLGVIPYMVGDLNIKIPDAHGPMAVSEARSGDVSVSVPPDLPEPAVLRLRYGTRIGIRFDCANPRCKFISKVIEVGAE